MSNTIVLRVISKAGIIIRNDYIVIGRSRIELPATAKFSELKQEVTINKNNNIKLSQRLTVDEKSL